MLVLSYVGLWAAITWTGVFAALPTWLAIGVFIGVNMAVGAAVGEMRALTVLIPLALVLWVDQGLLHTCTGGA